MSQSHQDGNRQQQNILSAPSPRNPLSVQGCTPFCTERDKNPASSFSGPRTHQIHTHVLYPLCCYSHGNHKKLEREQRTKVQIDLFQMEKGRKGYKGAFHRARSTAFLIQSTCLFTPARQSSYIPTHWVKPEDFLWLKECICL